MTFYWIKIVTVSWKINKTKTISKVHFLKFWTWLLFTLQKHLNNSFLQFPKSI